MPWAGPIEKNIGAATLEQRLREDVDQFRAALKGQEFAGPIRGIS